MLLAPFNSAQAEVENTSQFPLLNLPGPASVEGPFDCRQFEGAESGDLSNPDVVKSWEMDEEGGCGDIDPSGAQANHLTPKSPAQIITDCQNAWGTPGAAGISDFTAMFCEYEPGAPKSYAGSEKILIEQVNNCGPGESTMTLTKKHVIGGKDNTEHKYGTMVGGEIAPKATLPGGWGGELWSFQAQKTEEHSYSTEVSYAQEDWAAADHKIPPGKIGKAWVDQPIATGSGSIRASYLQHEPNGGSDDWYRVDYVVRNYHVAAPLEKVNITFDAHEDVPPDQCGQANLAQGKEVGAYWMEPSVRKAGDTDEVSTYWRMVDEDSNSGSRVTPPDSRRWSVVVDLGSQHSVTGVKVHAKGESHRVTAGVYDDAPGSSMSMESIVRMNVDRGDGEKISQSFGMTQDWDWYQINSPTPIVGRYVFLDFEDGGVNSIADIQVYGTP
ncbi:hypothetical protein ABZ532_31425 [Streptomyces sp. NPDC019396]|uniref:hypothetical protein n=1 Tax=Streptomyces sp. NPDC019396 TaxID=3154687 RepID=UPI00340C9793